jgi:hypothetical protein
MAGACSTYGARSTHIGLWWENSRKRDDLEEPSVYKRIILKWIFKKCEGCVKWIDLAQNRDKWLALVSVVIKLYVL